MRALDRAAFDAVAIVGQHVMHILPRGHIESLEVPKIKEHLQAGSLFVNEVHQAIEVVKPALLQQLLEILSFPLHFPLL
jgi:hypothetical protein